MEEKNRKRDYTKKGIFINKLKHNKYRLKAYE